MSQHTDEALETGGFLTQATTQTTLVQRRTARPLETFYASQALILVSEAVSAMPNTGESHPQSRRRYFGSHGHRHPQIPLLASNFLYPCASEHDGIRVQFCSVYYNWYSETTGGHWSALFIPVQREVADGICLVRALRVGAISVEEKTLQIERRLRATERRGSDR